MTLDPKNLVLLLVVLFFGVNSQIVYADNNENIATPTVITPQTLKWSSFDAFPPGAEAAVLSGDPSSAGPFLIRLRVPPHYKLAPNWETVTVYVTVLSGSYHIGVGDTFNAAKGRTLTTASTVIIPQNSHHYFWTTTGAVLQVHGIGPWGIHYINSADDPRNSK